MQRLVHQPAACRDSRPLHCRGTRVHRGPAEPRIRLLQVNLGCVFVGVMGFMLLVYRPVHCRGTRVHRGPAEPRIRLLQVNLGCVFVGVMGFMLLVYRPVHCRGTRVHRGPAEPRICLLQVNPGCVFVGVVGFMLLVYRQCIAEGRGYIVDRQNPGFVCCRWGPDACTLPCDGWLLRSEQRVPSQALTAASAQVICVVLRSLLLPSASRCGSQSTCHPKYCYRRQSWVTTRVLHSLC
jgi:hypothetical protein